MRQARARVMALVLVMAANYGCFHLAREARVQRDVRGWVMCPHDDIGDDGQVPLCVRVVTASVR